MRLISHGLLILTAIIWGTTFVFQTTGMETLGPLGFTAARFLVGAIALLPIALFEARRVSLISQFSAVDAAGFSGFTGWLICRAWSWPRG
jgi:drug/metabolite transporter (DMT)-like permease